MNRTNRTYHTLSGAYLIIYHYKNEPDSSLSVSDNMAVDVSETYDLLSYEFSKTISDPSGSFTIQLPATKNWKSLIRNGDWLVLWAEKDGKTRPFLLNVDRVARTKQLDEDGRLSIRYTISGRDFGKVFEKTNIYYNPNLSRQLYVGMTILNTKSPMAGSPDFMITRLLDMFLGTQFNSKLNKEEIGVEVPELNQWFIPQELKQQFANTNSPVHKQASLKYVNGVPTETVPWPSFYDILDASQISLCDGYNGYRDISSMSGYLWNLLKQNSNEVINELFNEMHYVGDQQWRPSLVLRMIPFTEEDFKPLTSHNQSINSKIIKFQDLPSIELSDDQVLDEDMGETDHVRFNYFVVGATNDMFAQQVSVGILGASPGASPLSYPQFKQASMHRSGTLARTDTTDFAFWRTEELGDGVEVLRAWNELVRHWFDNSHRLESGTMTINGNLDIELGKRLDITYKALNETWQYYIEGYSHQWQYPNLMTTSLQLTRGRRAATNKKYIEDQNSSTRAYTGQTQVNK